MIRDLLATIRRQQGGVLLDTNILLLFLMMAAEREYVFEWKRTERFTPDHVAAMDLLLSASPRLVTTPHILTEVTDLATGIRSDLRAKFAEAVQTFVRVAKERYVDSRVLSKDTAFVRLGLADVAQLLLPARARPLIVTDDAKLFLELEQRELPRWNINHDVFAT
jgi:hypothetical protein